MDENTPSQGTRAKNCLLWHGSKIGPLTRILILCSSRRYTKASVRRRIMSMSRHGFLQQCTEVTVGCDYFLIRNHFLPISSPLPAKIRDWNGARFLRNRGFPYSEAAQIHSFSADSEKTAPGSRLCVCSYVLENTKPELKWPVFWRYISPNSLHLYSRIYQRHKIPYHNSYQAKTLSIRGPANCIFGHPSCFTWIKGKQQALLPYLFRRSPNINTCLIFKCDALNILKAW